MQAEIWKQVPGFNGAYEVSDLGNIRSYDRVDASGRNLKGTIKQLYTRKDGYVETGLTKEGKTRLYYVHQLVMLVFSPDNSNETVNHINGIKQDNRLINLEWLSHADNCKHRDKVLNPNNLGCTNPNYKGDILVFKNGMHIMTLQGTTDTKEKGFDPGHVSKCLSGKAKTHKGCTFKRA